MNFSRKPAGPDQLFPALQKSCISSAASHNFIHSQKVLCALMAVTWPCAAALAQSSPSSQQSSPASQASSQQSSTQTQTSSQAQPGTSDPTPQKEDSLAETARKAKEKKASVAKGKVYSEDDLAGLKGPGVSVVGEVPTKGALRGQPIDADQHGGENNEQYWRKKARQILDAIAATDEQIAQKKEEIKKLGSGGFDVTTGFKNSVAYIHDRNAQLKKLEQHKVDLQKQLDDLQDEGRKVGAPASWFR